MYHWDKIKDHIWRTHGNCAGQHDKETFDTTYEIKLNDHMENKLGTNW